MPARKRSRGRLDPYRRKRDFRRSPEPPGGRRRRGNLFVIQEHHARSHHFDLRLEMDGVLVSWAVPKGMPEQTSEKRLAIHVEDHPLDYAGFSGEIPKGHYGAGRVEIWDQGRWEPVEDGWRRGFAKGKLKFRLSGGRLDGDYLLARMEEPNWLLRRLPAAGVASADAEEEPAFVEPQLAKVVSSVPGGPEWVHEIKYDGYRLIAVRRGGGVRLFTRSGLDWTDRFGGLAGEIAALPGGDLVLDGEAVRFDAKGRSSFGMLQESLKEGGGDITYVAFDLLHQDGRNLRRLPLAERVERLAAVVSSEIGCVRRSKQWAADEGADLFRQACELGLEGIISKRADGRYLAGRREAWVKSKCRPRQEFVICGYTDPQGTRTHFGALVLGTFENGRLVPRGKVGTGFGGKRRAAIHRELRKRETERRHFPEMKDVHWVEPELIAEVEFAELTRAGSVRQAAFVALRSDKAAADVRLESAASAADEPVAAGIRISHPDRIVFPRAGVTKLEVARYFERVAEWMLPHVADRPLALLRAPEGAGGQVFFQKSFRTGPPKHVRQTSLDDGTEVLSIRSVEGLVSLAQHGVLEVHPWGSRLDRPDRPDLLIWDLDPDDDVPWKLVLGAAFLIRDFLADKGLRTWTKTSGGKGVHVMLPLRRRHAWDLLKPFARGVAREIAALNPGRFTIRSAKSHRKGRIYIDWMRNGRGATCIAPWCPRARTGAPVSTPLDWDQLPDAAPAGFTLRGALPEPGEWAEWQPQQLPVALVRAIAGES